MADHLPPIAKPQDQADELTRLAPLVQNLTASRRGLLLAPLLAALPASLLSGPAAAIDPTETQVAGIKKGEVVTCTVTAVTDGGIEVQLASGLPGFIRKADLSRDRAEQRPDRFAVGEKVDAKITGLDRGGRKANLSIKAREIDEDKQAMAEFGSSDSGASLGDILGAALGRKGGDKDEKDGK